MTPKTASSTTASDQADLQALTKKQPSESSAVLRADRVLNGRVLLPTIPGTCSRQSSGTPCRSCPPHHPSLHDSATHPIHFSSCSVQMSGIASRRLLSVSDRGTSPVTIRWTRAGDRNRRRMILPTWDSSRPSFSARARMFLILPSSMYRCQRKARARASANGSSRSDSLFLSSSSSPRRSIPSISPVGFPVYF